MRYPVARRLPRAYFRHGSTLPVLPRTDPSDVLKLLYVGRLAQVQKRVLELPRILERLRSLGRRCQLTIVGEGPDGEALRVLLKDKDLLGVAKIVGFVSPSELAPYYAENDVLVNLSDAEASLSLAVLEALKAGCVPVCTRLPDLDTEVMVDGNTCRLVSTERLDEMAEVLASLQRDEIQRMSEAGRRAVADMTVERTFSAIADLIDRARALRPLIPWPAEASALEDRLGEPWDLTAENPWIPHPGPLRRLAGRLVPGTLRRAIGTR